MFAFSSHPCAQIVGVTFPGERGQPYGRSGPGMEVMTVAYRDDDDRNDLAYKIMMIMFMLAVLSTYTDLVGFFQG